MEFSAFIRYLSKDWKQLSYFSYFTIQVTRPNNIILHIFWQKEAKLYWTWDIQKLMKERLSVGCLMGDAFWGVIGVMYDVMSIIRWENLKQILWSKAVWWGMSVCLYQNIMQSFIGSLTKSTRSLLKRKTTWLKKTASFMTLHVVRKVLCTSYCFSFRFPHCGYEACLSPLSLLVLATLYTIYSLYSIKMYYIHGKSPKTIKTQHECVCAPGRVEES